MSATVRYVPTGSRSKTGQFEEQLRLSRILRQATETETDQPLVRGTGTTKLVAGLPPKP